MTVQSRRKLGQRGELEKVTEPGLFVQHLLKRQVRADQVSSIDGFARDRTGPWEIVGAIDVAADPVAPDSYEIGCLP